MSKKRGAYRSRKLETKLRDNDRRRESAIYSEEEKKNMGELEGEATPTHRDFADALCRA